MNIIALEHHIFKTTMTAIHSFNRQKRIKFDEMHLFNSFQLKEAKALQSKSIVNAVFIKTGQNRNGSTVIEKCIVNML